jgi:hypothetical protein
VTEAQTAPDDPDPRLRGRTLPIPFDRVWNESRTIVDGWRRWRVLEADDYDGIIRAEVQTVVFGRMADVVIHIGLDEDAQTRVDMGSSSRKGFGDLGSNARRISRFFKKLDRALARPANQAKSPIPTPTPRP